MADDSVLGIKSEALRLLTGLETGAMDLNQAFEIAEDLDPVIIYFIVRYLRESYGPSNPHSKGVPGREQFDDTYSIRYFYNKQEEFIGLIVDKVEG